MINNQILVPSNENLKILDNIVEIRNEKNDLSLLKTTKNFDIYDIVKDYLDKKNDKEDIINLLHNVNRAHN